MNFNEWYEQSCSSDIRLVAEYDDWRWDGENENFETYTSWYEIEQKLEEAFEAGRASVAIE